MQLYISNFDAAPLAKGVVAGVLAILLAWAITPSNLSFDEVPVGGVETLNELVLEQYTYEHARKPIVLVGSSIQALVPPPECRPENAATIYLQGRSGQSPDDKFPLYRVEGLLWSLHRGFSYSTTLWNALAWWPHRLVTSCQRLRRY